MVFSVAMLSKVFKGDWLHELDEQAGGSGRRKWTETVDGESGGPGPVAACMTFACRFLVAALPFLSAAVSAPTRSRLAIFVTASERARAMRVR